MIESLISQVIVIVVTNLFSHLLKVGGSERAPSDWRGSEHALSQLAAVHHHSSTKPLP